MSRSKTPSYVLELKLNTSARDEEVLQDRFFAAFMISNAMTRHAKKAIESLRQDKEYRSLMEQYRKLKGNSPEIKKTRAAVGTELSAVRERYGLSEFQFYKFVSVLQFRYRKKIDSLSAQKIASDVWQGVESVLFGKGRKLHFVKLDDVRSIEGKNNASGIRFRGGRVKWFGLSIQPRIRKDDTYAQMALRDRVKYCRIVRKPVGIRFHYYIQLVLEGVPPKKHAVGEGRVGIDPGTLSAAVVSEKGGCILTALNEGVADHEAEIARLSRKMDRSRRATNLKNYNPDGTIRKGTKTWVRSKTYRQDTMRKRSLERKASASLRQHHEILANEIVAMGDEIYTEEMNYQALQRRKKETTVNKHGRFDRKKRFGRSLKSGAPAMLLSIIGRKLQYEGRTLHKVNTRTFRASQYNHVTDDYVKKRLSKRHNTILGRWVQRDLYSAFLLMNSDETLEHADRGRCLRTFESFLEDHGHCIAELINSNRKLLSSFGVRRAV